MKNNKGSSNKGKSSRRGKRKPSKKGKPTKDSASSLFLGVRVLKHTQPLDVYACTPFDTTGTGSCGTCLGSYTC